MNQPSRKAYVTLTKDVTISGVTDKAGTVIALAPSDAPGYFLGTVCGQERQIAYGWLKGMVSSNLDLGSLVQHLA